MTTSFWLALMFLTRIPAPRLRVVTDRDHGRALARQPDGLGDGEQRFLQQVEALEEFQAFATELLRNP